MNRNSLVLVTSLSLLLVGEGCHSRSSHRVVVENAASTFAGDFQALADYLNDPAVKSLLDRMPSHPGDTPPDVTGSYEADGIVTFATDDTLVGLDSIADFCFGPAINSELNVEVLDPSIESAGARSFIEGSGDFFTVYTAFRSIQTLETNESCEIHEVNVISGQLLPDGSIGDLVVGLAIVGLVGRCDDLFVDDLQISDMTGRRVGEGCAGDTPPVDEPQDSANVIVEVENNLVVDVLIFLGSETTPVAQIGAEQTGSFETAPGFALEFESLQPLGGTDAEGADILMGEIITGAFSQDGATAGSTSVYAIENQVGSDIFFAPMPVNRTDLDLFSVVNVGFDSSNIPGYLDAPGSGLDCFCVLPPSPDPFVVGYYSYSAPGLIDPVDANVRFFNVDDETEVADFQGPFNLEEFSGAITMRVE